MENDIDRELPASLGHDPILMDDFLLKQPGWLLRFGAIIITIGLFAGLTLSWLIEYPDHIEAPFILTSENPPISIVSKVSTLIDTILITDQTDVQEGEEIAVMKSTTDWQDVKYLINWLTSSRQLTNAAHFDEVALPKDIEFGSMQPMFSELQQNIGELQYFLDQSLAKEKVSGIELEIIHIEELNQSLRTQSSIFNNEITLLKRDYQRAVLLNKSKSVSDKELEGEQIKLLQQERALEAMQSGIILNDIQIRQLRTQKFELLELREQDLNTRYIIIQENISRLLELIKNWEENYLIVAPISGKLTFPTGITNQKFIQNTQSIATIIPQSGKGKIICRADVPTFGVGKIKLGDRVRIRLDAYPDNEYGVLDGQVDRFALMPSLGEGGQNYHQIEIYLPDSLKTNYGISIPFKQQLSGRITIITAEKRLLERIFKNILSILKTY